jgi:ABC-type nickel/cobalt efflux system permease component RcnA
MTESLPIFAGILASTLHVISGPDHLAAVTPLILETKKRAWKVGLFWGFGHLAGMLLIGILFLIFKEYIPFERISEYSEQLVGIVLIGVGLWAFYRIFNKKEKHVHPHVHSGQENYIHIHEHNHKNSKTHNQHTHKEPVKQNFFSSFLIGLLHGFAGVAHFLLLLPVLGFATKFESIQYIFGFGIGSVLAMTIYAIILTQIAMYSKKEPSQSFFNGIRFAGGLFAVLIGVYWIYTGF